MTLLEKIQDLRREVQETYDLETNPVALIMDANIEQLELMVQHLNATQE